MNEDELVESMRRAIVRAGAPAVAAALDRLAEMPDESATLTLVANAGVHLIPTGYLKGEVYEVSRGNWKATDEAALAESLSEALFGLSRKLQSQTWTQVYLVPTGHPVLSAHIKLMVYRLLRINTVDLYYTSGRYLEVDLDHREIALAANSDRRSKG